MLFCHCLHKRYGPTDWRTQPVIELWGRSFWPFWHFEGHFDQLFLKKRKILSFHSFWRGIRFTKTEFGNWSPYGGEILPHSDSSPPNWSCGSLEKMVLIFCCNVFISVDVCHGSFPGCHGNPSLSQLVIEVSQPHLQLFQVQVWTFGRQLHTFQASFSSVAGKTTSRSSWFFYYLCV